MLPVPVRSVVRHTSARFHRLSPVPAVVDAPDRSQLKKELQARQRAWLQEVVRITGLSLTQIARKSDVSDTTLTRLVNRPNYDGTLTQLVIDRIKETFKVPGPEEYASARRPLLGGFGEAERFDMQAEPPALAKVIAALLGGRAAVDAWRLKTAALEEVGYLPGDIVLVDLNAQPMPQDAVCAQVYDWTRGGAETVWRVFDPPFLVAAARERTAYKPLLVDNERAIIKGVIVESLRPHRLSATR